MDIEISILIVLLNAQQYVVKMLNSINKQTIKNIQIIFVDGGSKDNTLDLIKQFEYRKGIRYTFIDNSSERSIVHSYLRGLEEVNTPYVYQLCSDDVLYDQDWLEKGINYLNNNPHVDAVQGRSLTVDESGRILACYPPIEFGILSDYDYLIYRIAYDLVLADSTVMFRRDCLKKIFPKEDYTNKSIIYVPHTIADINFLNYDYVCKFIDGICQKSLHHIKRRSYLNIKKELQNNIKIKRNRYKILFFKIKKQKKLFNKIILLTLLMSSWMNNNGILSSLQNRIAKILLRKFKLISIS